MDLYIMEAKKYIDMGYVPLGKAKLVHVKDWKEAKKEANRLRIYAMSRVFIGEAVKENGFVDISKPYMVDDGRGWKRGR